MNLIAFVTDGPEVRNILTHIGAEPEASRGPPLWEDCDAPQIAADDQLDQRISRC